MTIAFGAILVPLTLPELEDDKRTFGRCEFCEYVTAVEVYGSTRLCDYCRNTNVTRIKDRALGKTLAQTWNIQLDVDSACDALELDPTQFSKRALFEFVLRNQEVLDKDLYDSESLWKGEGK